MQSIRVDMNGVPEYLAGLPIALRREIDKEGINFLQAVKKSALLRAPVDTGELKRETKGPKKEGNTIILSFNSRGAYFQEVGFKPHFIYSENGTLMGDGWKRKSNKFWADGLHWVSKNKPFIGPAFEANISKITQRLDKATNKALKGGKSK